MRGISMRGVLQLGGACFVVAMVTLVHVGSRVRACCAMTGLLLAPHLPAALAEIHAHLLVVDHVARRAGDCAVFLTRCGAWSWALL